MAEANKLEIDTAAPCKKPCKKAPAGDTQEFNYKIKEA